ncbi:hypothetical protein [Tsukamurella strandjordii]|uniref:hypothetical protein n=1 Tax=Tsukamurella strandjordii TaxID=147577 RepID=UPI0031D85F96
MTENAPDDKTPAADAQLDEAAEQTEATEEAAAPAESATETEPATTTEPAAETEPAAPAKPAPVKKKPKPAPVVEEDDEDEEEAAPVVRKRPRPAPQPAAAAPSASATTTTVIITVAVIAVIAAAAIFGFLYFKTRGELNDQKAADADRAHAEKVAADYATGASTFDYRDLGSWTNRLTTGVSPALKNKYEATTGAMNQLLQPLQWVSKGTVMDAVVSSESGPVYKVNAYVSVDVTNAQAPSGRTTMTVYNITLNKDDNWQITDVGGPGSPGGVATEGNPAAPVPAPTETAPAPAPAPTPGN